MGINPGESIFDDEEEEQEGEENLGNIYILMDLIPHGKPQLSISLFRSKEKAEKESERRAKNNEEYESDIIKFESVSRKANNLNVDWVSDKFDIRIHFSISVEDSMILVS